MAKLKTHWGYRSRAICGLKDPPFYSTDEKHVTCEKCRTAIKANKKRVENRYK